MIVGNACREFERDDGFPIRILPISKTQLTTLNESLARTPFYAIPLKKINRESHLLLPRMQSFDRVTNPMNDLPMLLWERDQRIVTRNGCSPCSKFVLSLNEGIHKCLNGNYDTIGDEGRKEGRKGFYGGPSVEWGD